jgi:hypothetical protein
MMVFISNPFEPATSFQQPKEVTKKGRSLPKFLTAKKARKAVAEPPKLISTKSILVISAALTLQVPDFIFLRIRFKPANISLHILFTCKYRMTIIPSLDQVFRQACAGNSLLSGH